MPLSSPSAAVELERARHRLALGALALPRFDAGQGARPFVVALEGHNGAGKSTLRRGLCRALAAPGCMGADAAWLAEPLKRRMIGEADWFASAMFFLSGYFEQMRRLRHSAAPLVIMDRSLWSTLAVQAAESAQRLEALLAMLAAVAGQVRIPSLTLVLEASFATCQSRIGHKRAAARALDDLTASAAFHAREQEFYSWRGRQVPALVFLNVEEASPSEVLERALALIRERVPC